MGIVREIVKRGAKTLCLPGTFMYARPDGVVELRAARNSGVINDSHRERLLARIHELIGSSSTLGIEYGDSENAIITLARVGAGAKLLSWNFKFMLIYERRAQNIFAVFYINGAGEIKWIAGPGNYGFERVWDELEDLAARAWSEAA